MTKRAIAPSALFGLALAAVTLAACGGSDSLKRADLPPSLSRVLSRLEKKGHDVQPREVGLRDIPGLVVDSDSSHPVLLVAAPKGRSVDRLDVPTGLTGVEPTLDMSVGCGRFLASGADSDSPTRVLRLGGVCRRRK